MILCENCHVSLPDNQLNCPLCHRSVQTVQEGEMHVPNPRYPAYLPSKKGKVRAFLYRLFLFVSIAAGILTLYINWMTWKTVARPWSLFVIIPLLYLWLLVGNTILSKMHPGAKIILHVLGLSCMLFLFDLLTGYERWSVNFVIPFLVIHANLLMTVIVFARKMLWNDYIGYAIAIIPVGFLPLLLYVIGIATTFWTCAAPAVCAILTILAMFIFAQKKFKSEVIRRFHF